MGVVVGTLLVGWAVGCAVVGTRVGFAAVEGLPEVGVTDGVREGTLVGVRELGT